MTIQRQARDAGDLFNSLETRVGRLERRGRGFSVPVVEANGGVISSDDPPPAPSDPDTLWIDTNDGNKIYRWDGAVWVPTMDPAVDIDRNNAAVSLVGWQDEAASSDGLVVLYRQSAAPGASGLSTGDLWVDSDTNVLWRWSGSAWGSLSDTTLGVMLAGPNLTSTVADGRVRTWWQFNAPTPTGFGDLWVNTSTSPYTLSRWNNYDWIPVLDWSIILQQEQLDTKISTWYLPGAPVAQAVGDLWYNTADLNHPYRAESEGANAIAPDEWVSVRDESIEEAADAAAEANAAAFAAMTAAEAAQATADGNITTYYASTPPWANGSTGHAANAGDMWFDTDDGMAYRWNDSTKTWDLIQDNAIAAALAAAQNAQTTADGKITAYYQDTQPVVGEIGDLWYDTNDNNKPYFCSSTSPVTWTSVQDGDIATAQATADQAVHSYVTEYSVNSSETVAPITGWSTATPTRAPGTFVWVRTTVTRNDGTTATTSPALMTGNTGATGTAAVVSLTTTTQVLTQASGGGATTPATATVTGVATGTTITVWEYSVDSGAFSATPPAGVSRTGLVVTITGASVGSARTITVRAADAAGVADTLTVARVSNGATGGTGPAGADAYTVFLTNEAHGFPGSSTAALAGSATSQVIAYKGTTLMPATIGTITGQVTGLTTALSNNGTTSAGFTVTVTTALTQQNGVLTVPITVDGVSFTKTFSWSVNRAGATGSQGIPGAPGADGNSLFTWLKYADSPTTGMSDLPAGKLYMGLAYNKTSATESSIYTDYDWSLIQGPQGNTGVAGPPGADGQPTYTWIKYGTSSAGAGLSDTPGTNPYIGIAYNKTTAAESSNPLDYEWSLIQGPPGTNAATVSLTSTTQVLSVPAAGGATTPATAVVTGTAVNTTITAWTYSVDGAAFSASVPTGVSRTGNVVTITGSTMTAKTIAVKMADAAGIADTLTVAKVADGATGATGGTGPTGVGVTGTTVTYQVGSSGTTAPTGTWVSSPQATVPGQFLWTRTITSFSDTSTSTAYSVAAHGTTGNTGTAGVGVTGTAVTYQVGASGTVAPVGTWQATPQATTVGQFLWTRTITSYSDTSSSTAYSVSAHGATGSTGAAGADAYTVLLTNESQSFAANATNALATSATTTVIAYKGAVQQTATVGTITGGATGISAAVTNNGTTAPLVTFTVTTALTAANGTFTIPVTVGGITFTQVFTWSLAFTGAVGANGSPGTPAATIDLTATTQVLTSPAAGGATTPATAVVTGTATNTTITVWEYSVDGGAFSATVPTGASRTGNVVTITGATMTARTIAVRMASAGGAADTLTVAKSLDGATGATGGTGPTGVGVTGTTVTYQVHTNGTTAPTGTWVSSPQATSPGQFLWTRTVTDFSNSTSSTAYSVAAHGTTGNTGTAGVGVTGTVVEYQVGASGTTAPVSTWQPTPQATTVGQFLWTRTITSYSNSTNSTAYSVSAHGATGSTGAAGADAYTVLLSNEAQTFPAGTTNALATTATSTVIAYKGTVQQTATVGTITGGATGITAAVTNNGTTAPLITFTVTTALVTPSGSFTVPVTVGGITFTQVFTWSLAFAGATGAGGAPGTPAATIDLTATTQILTSPAAGGATTPATAVVTGTATNTTISDWQYSVDGGAFSATVPTGASRTGNVVTITGSTMTARTIAVRMASAGGSADTLTVSKAFDGATGATGSTGGTGPAGADAYTVLLTNESQTFAAGTTNALATTATATVIAYKGNVQQVATVGTITGGATGISAAVTNNGTTAPLITFTVTTALTAANGTFTIPITVGGVTFTQFFTWSLSFAGATGANGTPGAPAANIDLTATTQVLASPNGGGATTPATAVVTGTATNTTITVYEYSVDGAAFSATVPTGASRTGNVVTITGATMTARAITVRMADASGTADTFTVAKTFDGATGGTGAPGTPGVGVTGTTVTYQVHSNGTTAPVGTWQATPQATSPGQFLWTRTITNFSDSSSSTAYSIAAHGTTGSTGTPGVGVSGTVVEYQVHSNGTTAPVGTWLSTPQATTTGQFLWTRTTTSYTSGAPTLAYSVSAHGATGAGGAAGADAYSVLLTNEAQTFAAGTTNALATTATTTVVAYKGSVQQTATVGTITGGATGISAAVTNNGTTAPLITFTVTTALATANGTFTIPITVGGITFTQVFSWSLAFSGAAGAGGAPGAPAPNIDLTATTQILSQPAAGGATTPTTSVVTGTPTNTTITVWEYSTDGSAFSATPPTGASRTGNVVTITGGTMTAKTMTVRMADAAGTADTLTVARSVDGATGGTGGTGPAGADAYTVLLTNEANVFPGTATAAIAGSTTSQVLAYKGTVQQTATIGTITGQVTGLTTAITNNGTTTAGFTVTVTTALVTTSGTLVVPITVDGVAFTKRFSWSLSLAGTPAATINLTATTQALVSPAAGGATTPATATITGTPTGTTITVWDYSVNSGAFSTTAPAGVSIAGNVVTVTGSTMTASTIAVRASNGAGVSDTMTVSKVLNGATGGTGGTGPAGADAYTVLLTNEAQVFPGTTAAAVAGSATSQVIAYKAAVLMPATIGTITGQVTGLTTAITNNGTTTAGFTVTVTTALVTQSGILTVPITVDGVSFSQRFSWSVSYAGATGGTGPGGVSVTAITPFFALVTPIGGAAPTVPAAGTVTPSAPWVATEPAYTANTELYRTERITYSSGPTSWTAVSKVSSYTAANAKTTTFRQSSIPVATAIGDLWVDTDDNKMYRAASIGSDQITAGEWVITSSDGLVPSLSPTPTVAGGVGALHVGWTAVVNNDPVLYRVYVDTKPTFTPDANNYAGATNATSFTVKQVQKNVVPSAKSNFESTDQIGALWLTGSFDGTAPAIERTATAAEIFAGQQGMKFTLQAISGFFYDYDPGVPVVAGQSYVARARMKSETVTRDGRVNVSWRDATGAALTTSSGPTQTVNSAGWTLLESAVTAPAGAAFGNIAVGPVTNGTAGDVYFIDLIELIEVTGKDGPRPGVMYYVKTIASDDDGSAAASAVGSGDVHQVTNEDIATNYIYAGMVNADQLRAGEMKADITISGKFKTAASGRRVEIDPTGINFFRSDNGNSISLPTDDTQLAYFSGSGSFNGLTVRDGLEVRGLQNTFARGSRTILQTQTAGSQTPPGLVVDYDNITLSIQNYVSSCQGAFIDENEYVQFEGAVFFGDSHIRTQAGANWYRFPYVGTNGIFGQSEFQLYGGIVEVYDTAALEYRMVGLGNKMVANADGTASHQRVELRKYDISLLNTSGTVAPTLVGSAVTHPRLNGYANPVVGRNITDRTKFVTAEIDQSAQKVVLRNWSNAMVQEAIVTTAALPNAIDYFRDVRGMVYGRAVDMGFHPTDTTPVFVVYVYEDKYEGRSATLPQVRQTAYVFRASDAARLSTYDFPINPATGGGVFTASHSVAGAGGGFKNFIGGQTAGSNNANTFTRYSNITWTTESSQWWVGYTWYDSNPLGATSGTHETNLSTMNATTMVKRAQITATSPALPDPAAGPYPTFPRLDDDVNAIRVYMGRGGTAPIRTAMTRQTSPANLATTITYKTPIDFTATALLQPPASSNFPNDSSAAVESSAVGADGLPKFQLKGDGFIHAEALDVSGAGASALTGKAFEQLYYSIRAQSQMLGGGIKATDASYNVSWSQRFILISMGNSNNTFPGGHHDITCPSGIGSTQKALTSNVVTLTVGNTHRFREGDRVRVALHGAPFDGDFTLTATTSTSVSYAATGANVGTTAQAGTVQLLVPGYGGQADVATLNGKLALGGWAALWYELPYGRGGAATDSVAVTNKMLLANTAVLNVASTKGIATGDRLVVSIGDPVFDGEQTITTVTATTVAFLKTNANVASAATTGTITPTGKDTIYGNFRLTNFSSDFVVPNNWILLVVRNNDLATTEWITGEQIDPGYDSDSPVFKQVILNSGSDAGTSAGNKPALRVGTITGTHLRIDGNEIVAMSDDNTQGTLILNANGSTSISGGSGVASFNGFAEFSGAPSGGTANVNFNTASNNRIRLISSARRFKTNIEDLTFTDEMLDQVMALRPVKYDRISDEDGSLEAEIGFIADEAEEIGLKPWCLYDKDGEIFSFDYFKWVVAQQAVLQQHRDKIKRLEARLNGLA